MHDPWTDRLSEYMDGDLTGEETAALETHLDECLACRDVLAGLREVARATAGLRDREPETDLWPDIRERIGGTTVRVEAGADVVPLVSTRRPRRLSFSVPQLLAASIAMMAVSGGAVWLATRTAATAPEQSMAQVTNVSGSFSADAAILVSSVEQEYRQAITELERDFEARRDRLDPETVRVVEENLQVIDDAIAEARAALARDPANGYLFRHLDQTLTRKVDLLRRAASATVRST